jgi:hypothetical protein
MCPQGNVLKGTPLRPTRALRRTFGEARDDEWVHVVKPEEVRLGAEVGVRESYRIVEQGGR